VLASGRFILVLRTPMENGGKVTWSTWTDGREHHHSRSNGEVLLKDALSRGPRPVNLEVDLGGPQTVDDRRQAYDSAARAAQACPDFGWLDSSRIFCRDATVCIRHRARI
jgi:hypothetical protein